MNEHHFRLAFYLKAVSGDNDPTNKKNISVKLIEKD